MVVGYVEVDCVVWGDEVGVVELLVFVVMGVVVVVVGGGLVLVLWCDDWFVGGELVVVYCCGVGFGLELCLY